MSSSNPEHSQSSSPHPQEPADVDALLSQLNDYFAKKQ